MALPARIISTRHASTSSAAPALRTRAHTVTARTAEARPMVKATADVKLPPSVRPALTVVPRRKRTARFLGVLCALVVACMLGAASFQTLLAQRQLELDKLEQDISTAREDYEVLRQERAELRSPGRLAGIAGMEGMVPARQSTFVQLSPDLVAVVQESFGQLASVSAAESTDALDQFRTVKSLTSNSMP